MQRRFAVVLLFAVGCDIDEPHATSTQPTQVSQGHLGDACSTTSDCPYAGICEDGYCYAGYACTDDASCANPGLFCRHDVCHPICHGDRDCHVGEVCTAAGTCEYADPSASPGCTHNCECPGGQVCNAGVCANPSSDGLACTAKSDCAGSQDCVDGHCRAACSPGAPCSTSETCVVGYCQPNVCTDDCECPSGLHCAQGVCGP
jgi:hypothetical protein